MTGRPSSPGPIVWHCFCPLNFRGRRFGFFVCAACTQNAHCQGTKSWSGHTESSALLCGQFCCFSIRVAPFGMPPNCCPLQHRVPHMHPNSISSFSMAPLACGAAPLSMCSNSIRIATCGVRPDELMHFGCSGSMSPTLNGIRFL